MADFAEELGCGSSGGPGAGRSRQGEEQPGDGPMPAGQRSEAEITFGAVAAPFYSGWALAVRIGLCRLNWMVLARMAAQAPAGVVE